MANAEKIIFNNVKKQIQMIQNVYFCILYFKGNFILKNHLRIETTFDIKKYELQKWQMLRKSFLII